MGLEGISPVSSSVGAGPAMIGLWAADKILGGIGRMANAGDVETAKESTWNIYQNKLDLLTQGTDLTKERIGSQYQSGMEDLDFGGRAMLTKLQDATSTAKMRSKMPTMGEVDTQSSRDMKNLFARYRSNQLGLMDQRDYGLRSADLTFQEGQASLEQERERTLASLPSTSFFGT